MIRRIERALPLGILLLAAAMRLWQLDAYPDTFHHDHSLIGKYALDLTPDGLWTRWYSVGGWWLLWTRLALEIFGPVPWVLRLPSVLSGLGVVWLVFLLGRRYGTRVGLFAAAWASTHHVQVIFSRLPYAYDSVGPMLFATYCAVRGWETNRKAWWLASGAVTGAALWAYWGTLFWVPMFAGMGLAVAWCRPAAFVERRVGLALASLACMATGPWLWAHEGHSSTARLRDYLLNPMQWGMTEWLGQCRYALSALFTRQDAGGWGVWSTEPVLIIPDLLLLFAPLLVRSRPLAAPSVPLFAVSVAAIVVVLIGNVLIEGASNFYHFLPALPFLSLLMGMSAARVRWGGGLLVLCMALNATVAWSGMQARTRTAPMAAVRWLATQRHQPCVNIIRPPDENPPMYAFVDRIPLIEGPVPYCPAAVVFPGQRRPRRPGKWMQHWSSSGYLRTWEGR